MLDLSLHIYDLCQNSIRAKASFIEIEIISNVEFYEIKITDNGIGMSNLMTQMVRNPFVTTKPNKQVGLGIPLFILTCEQTGGFVHIASQANLGTVITGRMYKHHLDAVPMGDITETIYLLFVLNQTEIVFKYNNFEISTEKLNNVSLKNNYQSLKDYLKRNIDNAK